MEESVRQQKYNVEQYTIVYRGQAQVTKEANEEAGSTTITWEDLGLPKRRHIVYATVGIAQNLMETPLPHLEFTGAIIDEYYDMILDSDGFSFRVNTPSIGDSYASELDVQFYYYIIDKDPKS